MALMPVAEALTAVLANIEPRPEELVALAAAHHRALARDIAALRTQPPQAMSAMDGYAVRSADATLAGVRLAVVGEVAAGQPFEGQVGIGQAARIFTGGVIPAGTDAVIIQEDVRAEGDGIILQEPAIAGRHIRAAGIDFREGDVLLKRGLSLSDRHLSLAAAMNHPELPVHERPKVALLATGDELVMPGSTPGPGQIVYSNGYALRALARAQGAEVVDLGIAVDTLDSTRDGIRRARESGADILVTSGGASVGDHDFVKVALEAEGVAMDFWKIAMRPGKPMMHGQLGSMRVLGLPGNPVSSYVCALLFLVPLIRALSGRQEVNLVRETARLGRDIGTNDGREDYQRAFLHRDSKGELIATPVSSQDSSLLANLAIAGALVVRPPFAKAASAGSLCEIVRLPD